MPRAGLIAMVLIAVTPSTGIGGPITSSPAPASLVRELGPSRILRSGSCAGLRLLEIERRDLWGAKYRAQVVARAVGKRWSVEEVSVGSGRHWAGCLAGADRTVLWIESDEPGYAVYVHVPALGTQHLRSGQLRSWETMRVERYRNSSGVDIGVRIVVGDKTREAITWRHPDGLPGGTGLGLFCGNATELDAATARR